MNKASAPTEIITITLTMIATVVICEYLSSLLKEAYPTGEK